MASDQLTVSVYRRLDNRDQGLDDHSPLAVELHELRAVGLHEAFDSGPDLEVVDWGDTDDVEPHELVDLVVRVVSDPAVSDVAVATLAWVGARLKGVVEEGLVDGVKAVFQRLLPQQKKGRVLNCSVHLEQGTVVVQADPVHDHVVLSVNVAEGSVTVRFEDLPDS